MSNTILTILGEDTTLELNSNHEIALENAQLHAGDFEGDEQTYELVLNVNRAVRRHRPNQFHATAALTPNLALELGGNHNFSIEYVSTINPRVGEYIAILRVFTSSLDDEED